MPPTFMPNRPARMLIGRASTVTMVSTNRLRLLSSLTLAAISSCSSLMRSCSDCMSRSTTENSSVAARSSCTSAAAIQPGGFCSRRNSAAGSGASRRCRRTSTRRRPPRRARLVVQPAGQQLVLDLVDPAPWHVAHDAHQHVGLGAHQALQQLGGGADDVAPVDGGAQPIGRAQRLAPRRQHQAAVDADPQRGDVGGVEARSRNARR